MDCEELNNKRLIQDEYEDLYFEFNSTLLYENFEQWLQFTLKDILKELENNIIELSACKDDEKPTLHAQMNDVYRAYLLSAQEPLKKFQAEIQNLFSIPSNVIIPGTELFKNNGSYTDNDIIRLKEDIHHLQERIIKEQVFLAKLKKIKSIIDIEVQPTFNAVNTLISGSKSILTSINGRANKILSIHEKSAKMYFEKQHENLSKQYKENKNLFE